MSQDSAACGWLALRRDVLWVLKTALHKHNSCFTRRARHWPRPLRTETLCIEEIPPTAADIFIYLLIYLWIYLFYIYLTKFVIFYIYEVFFWIIKNSHQWQRELYLHALTHPVSTWIICSFTLNDKKMTIIHLKTHTHTNSFSRICFNDFSVSCTITKTLTIIYFLYST